ncbi:alpha/beta fold hydrolase [Deinococcus sp. Marseille-Q6407]|uniref:alpha/beta hydrolase n=1 Tax=Deinococcus sp. Marseille-Q6407 TaxID=2969223 RepID=UPI0021C05398|nr:alpha/beta fold hydrolase [Deinococcus sp. Marseille-Q6407]
MFRFLPPLLAALAFNLPAAAAAQTAVPSLPSLAASEPSPAIPAQAAEAWHGTIAQRGRQVPVGLNLQGDNLQGDSAELWLPDQGIRGAAVRVVSDPAGGAFSVQLEHWPGQPRLQLTRSGTGAATVLSGTFQQGGFSSPLTLWRGVVTLPARPQEPRPPLPYRSQEVTVWGAGATALRGTLTLPAGPGPFPAALLLSGSGPQDRDSTLHGHRPFLVLADRLTRQGFAVLRLDDRGTGRSGGDLYNSRYSDLSGDAQAAVDFLRGLRTVQADRVGLIGHSEGGWVAAQAAQRLSPPPAFLVLLGSPAVPGSELLDLQLRAQLQAQGLGEAEIEARAAAQAEALAGHHASLLTAPLPSSEIEQAWLHSRAFVQSPYLQDFLAYDPRPALRANRVPTVPTLAVFGSHDLQVPPVAGAGPLRRLLSGPRSEVHELSGLNHLLQPARSGLPQEYAQIPTTLDPAALDLIGRWLQQAVR